MRCLALANQKGGVGKTTTTANLGHALSLLGFRVVLIDLDPQGQLTTSLGIFRPPPHGVDGVLRGESDWDTVSIHSRENLVLVPGGAELAEIVHFGELSSLARSKLLQEALQREPLDADFVLIDCPPVSGVLAANALLAVDEVAIPVTGDYLGLNGVAHLMATLKRFSDFRQTPLRQWVVISRLHVRRKLSREVLDKLLAHFPGKVLETPIREAAVMAECPAVGRTIFEYRRSSQSAKDFMSLARDLIEERTL